MYFIISGTKNLYGLSFGVFGVGLLAILGGFTQKTDHSAWVSES